MLPNILFTSNSVPPFACSHACAQILHVQSHKYACQQLIIHRVFNRTTSNWSIEILQCQRNGTWTCCVWALNPLAPLAWCPSSVFDNSRHGAFLPLHTFGYPNLPLRKHSAKLGLCWCLCHNSNPFSNMLRRLFSSL